MKFKSLLKSVTAALLLGGIACGLAACAGIAEISETQKRETPGRTLRISRPTKAPTSCLLS